MPTTPSPNLNVTGTPPLTVWPCHSTTSQPADTQQAGDDQTCRGASLITPVLADRIVGQFSPDGGLVVDPYTAADGALITAAAKAGRCAIGVHPDPARLDRAQQGLHNDVPADSRGVVELRRGEPGDLGALLDDVAGWVDLVATSPIYGFTHPSGQRPGDTGRGWDTCPVGDLLTDAAQLLRRGGLLVTVTANTHTTDGPLIDIAALTVVLAREAGLRYLQHIIALTAPIQDGALTPPEPAGHRHAADGAGGASRPAHADVLVFTASKTDPR
jgi:hypothetical protein